MTDIWHYTLGRNKRKYKGMTYSKKVIRLITGTKNMNPVDRNLKKIKFLW
jgi:hypothetical protein